MPSGPETKLYLDEMSLTVPGCGIHILFVFLMCIIYTTVLAMCPDALDVLSCRSIYNASLLDEFICQRKNAATQWVNQTTLPTHLLAAIEVVTIECVLMH